MTRQLVLMRHASAEGWSATGDRGRELSEEGRQEAAAAGELLHGLGIGQVLCSSATRTRQTLAQLGLRAPVDYLDALYEGGTATMAQLVGEVDDEVQAVLVVGHAPTVPALAATLAEVSDPQAADDLLAWFPTATVVHLGFEGPWSGLLTDETLRLVAVHRPGA